MLYIKYFIYIIEHKKNVFIECWKDKLYIHAFTHDLSKFFPSEFFPYARYFYFDKDRYNNEFQLAWKLHYRRNKHHWNSWVSENVDNHGHDYAFPMPEKYVKQMICDWKGMARKFGDTAESYFLKNENKMTLNPETVKLIKKNLRIKN